MLTCVYHPIDRRRIVEEDEAELLIKSGVWFDSPTEAKAYRAKVEEDVKQDKLAKAKTSKPKEKLQESVK